MEISKKAKYFLYVAQMYDMTIEERCAYCLKKFGLHYAAVHTLILNETGVSL